MNIHPLWYLCLLTRITLIFSLIYISKHHHHRSWVRWTVTTILGIMGIGFIYKYMTGSNNEIQIAKVFWHESRLLHGGLYIMAAYFYFLENIRMMTITLSIDIIGSLFYRLLSQQ